MDSLITTPLRDIDEQRKATLAAAPRYIPTPEPPPVARITLDVDGETANVKALFRTFSSGSKGYGYSGKVDGADGRRYQVSINLVLIGSKPTA